MRAIIAALAALGGGVLLAAIATSAATGDSSEVDWLVAGPLPFLVIGLAGFWRQPQNRVVWWLVGVGAAFGCDVAIGDVFLPLAENHWGSPPRAPRRSRCCTTGSRWPPQSPPSA